MKITRWLIITIGLLVRLSSFLFAADYYVAPDGNATWTQAININTPCSAQTAMANAVAGDMVFFRGGIYELGQSDNNQYGSGVLYPSNSGTSDSNRIVFEAYPGELPVLNTTVAEGNIISRAWGDRGHSYTTLRGFTISSTGTTHFGSVGIGAGSVGTIIDHCTFLGASTKGTNTDNISGVAFETSTYTVISNCKFSNYKDTVDNANTGAIKTYHAHYLTVKNCEFYNNTRAIFNKQDSDYNIYENNFIYNSKEHIVIGVDNIGDSSDGIIRNNFMVNATYCSVLLEQKENNYTPNWTICNNTIYNNSSSSRIISINNSTGRYLYNNIIVGDASESEVRYILGSTVNEDDHNLYYAPTLSIMVGGNTYSSLPAYQSSTILVGGGHPGAGSLASNPLFINTSGYYSLLSDFALALNSPAKNTGRRGVDMGADISLVGLQNTITSQEGIKGDLNSDGKVDITDVQACVNHILGVQDYGDKADVNGDGIVNVIDMQEIVNVILGN